MNKEDRKKKIGYRLMAARQHFKSHGSYFDTVESLIETAYKQNKFNNAYTQNALNILAKFISNRSARDIIDLIQEQLKSENNNG